MQGWGRDDGLLRRGDKGQYFFKKKDETVCRLIRRKSINFKRRGVCCGEGQ